MGWSARYRMRRWWRASLYAWPLTWAVAAIVAGVLIPRWDRARPWPAFPITDVDSARDQLSSISSGMMAFTGIVFTALVLVIQFGSTAYSPRLLRWFRRDPVVKHALGSFVASFLFAVLALGQVDRADVTAMPARTVLAAIALLFASVVMFLLLVNRVTNSLRLATVLQDIDKVARRSLDAVYPQASTVYSEDHERLEYRDLGFSDESAIQEIDHRGASAVVVAIDRSALARLGRACGGVIELVPQVGEYVGAGRPLAIVHGTKPISEADVRWAIVMGDERTADDDPAFALRLLVDIGIRALSPAINDPTTAVQVIDRIEDILAYAGRKDLAVGQVRDSDGVLRCLYPTPSWDDLLELAVTELRRYGRGSAQVPRRLLALLDALADQLPADRQEPIDRQRGLLNEWSAEDPPARTADEIAEADRLGIGGTQRPRQGPEVSDTGGSGGS